MNKNRQSSLVRVGGTIFIVSSVLAGCGGGGGGEETPPPAGGSADIQLGGVVAKGIISAGVVTAEELNSSGEAVRVVGSTVTDDAGKYQLTLGENYSGGPVRISISKNSTTKMKCDVAAGCGNRVDDVPDSDAFVSFGEWYKPSNLALTAMIPVASENEVVSVNVTPYTHMAASRALSQGNLDAGSIANANSEVSNLLGGIDILNTQPVDITDAAALSSASPSELAYASLSAAIATLADTDTNGEPNVADALQTLSDSFSGGVFAADDSGAAQDNEIFSLQEIVDAAGTTFAEAGITDTSGILAGLEEDAGSATDSDGDGVTDIDPEPSDSAGDANLAKVKAMIADMRTWGTVIANQIDTPSAAFGEQIDLATESSEAMGQWAIADAVKDAVEVALQYDGISNNLNQYTDEWGYSIFSSGTISSPQAGVIVIEGGVRGGYDEEAFTIDITLILPVDASTTSTLAIGIASANVVGLYQEGTIDSGLVTLNLASPYTVDFTALEEETAALPDIDSIKIDLELSFTQKLDWNASNATGEYAFYSNTAEENVLFSDPITFSGKLSTVLHPVIETDEFGEPDLTWMMPSTFVLSGTTSNTTGDSVTATLSGNISNAATFTPVSAESAENESNWLDADLGLSFGLQLDGLPEATVSITGDRTGFEAGTATVTVAFGNRQIVASASGNGVTEEVSGKITITNQDGVVLVITPNTEQTAGVLIYNGNVYGTVSETESGYLKIEYIDSTFEIM